MGKEITTMKLFHLSDLHIGKIVNGYEMWEDQRYVFDQILAYVREEQPDAVMIAGDIYDKAVPSAKDRFHPRTLPGCRRRG
jgi:exonuclease SbcD